LGIADRRGGELFAVVVEGRVELLRLPDVHPEPHVDLLRFDHRPCAPCPSKSVPGRLPEGVVAGIHLTNKRLIGRSLGAVSDTTTEPATARPRSSATGGKEPYRPRRADKRKL
jgi:hypothetical protein